MAEVPRLAQQELWVPDPVALRGGTPSGHPSRGSGAGLEPSLGVLLLDFLRLYGRALNADHAAVSCRWRPGPPCPMQSCPGATSSQCIPACQIQRASS